jgi:cellulose synthase/poly-beta-1,6-N-acetylglucosamine synthase-like glycosyltransferase
VESPQDSAVPVIKQLIKHYNRGTLVIAGKAHTCCQKNHNLIAAVAKTDRECEVYVFVDSDIALYPEWLEKITAPLADSNIAAVTGFRWLYTHKASLPHIAHSFQNYTIFTSFALSSHMWNDGLWGGSTALRKKDFHELRVTDVWNTASVDDLSLSRILQKNARKTVFSYHCITPTTKTLTTIADIVSWYKRQIQYLRFYQKRNWIPVWCISAVYLFSIPASVPAIIRFLSGASFFESGMYLPLILIIGPMTYAAGFPLLGNRGNIFFQILYAPLSMIIATWATFITAFTSVISWSGYRYRVDPGTGKVKTISSITEHAQ